MKHNYLAILMVFISTPALAWDGIDSDTRAKIEIESGNLVRSGNDIEIFDWREREYRDVEVQSITNDGFGVNIEVYDYSSGTYRSLEMEDE